MTRSELETKFCEDVDDEELADLLENKLTLGELLDIVDEVTDEGSIQVVRIH